MSQNNDLKEFLLSNAKAVPNEQGNTLLKIKNEVNKSRSHLLQGIQRGFAFASMVFLVVGSVYLLTPHNQMTPEMEAVTFIDEVLSGNAYVYNGEEDLVAEESFLL